MNAIVVNGVAGTFQMAAMTAALASFSIGGQVMHEVIRPPSHQVPIK